MRTLTPELLSKNVQLYKGDQLLDEGTVEQVAAARGVQAYTILWYLTAAYQRRLAKRKTLDRSLFLVDLDEEDEL
jgi:hypothetical protein